MYLLDLCKHPIHVDSGSRLFYGKIRQRLATVSPDSKSRASVHEKEDLFSHLPVNVAEDGFDLYDGLSGYFDDVVEFEGKKAQMEVSLVDLPPLLQVQLQVKTVNRFNRPSLIVHCPESSIQPRDFTTLQVASICQIWRNYLHGSFPRCRRRVKEITFQGNTNESQQLSREDKHIDP